MSTNIEIEAKALVSEKDFQKFIEHFKKISNKPYKQINYYIDDEERSLANSGISLRIRKKDGYELTLKTPLSEGLLEKNQIISDKEFNEYKKGKFPVGDISRFLEMLGFDLTKLKILNSLTTTRVDVNYLDGLLSLDKNEYNKTTDYEIEYEYNSKIGAVTILKKLFAKLKVTYKENKQSKVFRAFSTK